MDERKKMGELKEISEKCDNVLSGGGEVQGFYLKNIGWFKMNQAGINLTLAGIFCIMARAPFSQMIMMTELTIEGLS
jgi:hypothetical protein